MAVPTLRPTKQQLDDLAIICGIPSDQLAQTTRQINEQQVTISRRKIEATISTILSSMESHALSRFLLGAALAMRRRSVTPHDFVDGVSSHVKSLRDGEKRFAGWDERRSEIELLLNLSSVKLAAKAFDISYDFERVFTEARLITSIRPVFNDDKDEIIGSTVVQTLRLEYTSLQGEHTNLSVALDLDDVRSLLKSCAEAITKAEASVRLMDMCKIEAVRIGEKDE
jgi:hypothetical protein